ncbi:ester cyclase [Vulgatibacter sp.]|uniref:ester cyclase n=1 Tax=Vulgatibacter sp. TaxID=1971226 RepID=UPI003569E731
MADNVELARQIFDEAWVHQSRRAYEQDYADDAVIHDPIEGALDKTEYDRRRRRFLRSIEILDLRPDRFIDGGEDVVVRYSMRARMRGPLLGIQPTGREGTIHGIVIFRFRDGRVIEQWQSWDTIHFLRQVGAVEAEPPAQRDSLAGWEEEPTGGHPI